MIEKLSRYYVNLNKETIRCPVCYANDYSILHDNDRYSMGVQTVICTVCSLIYINPRPIEEEMSEFYKEHYRKVYESIEQPNKDYINKGPFISRARFVLEKLIPYLKISKSFLDIGCAEGTLLKLVEKNYNNLKTLGIEPSNGFGNYAKKYVNGEVYVGTYQEYLKENKISKYDVVATTHVLEHILNPQSFLKGISSFMHDKSVLYIEVPNIMDNKVKGIGNIHLGHVLYFDPETIKILLDKCGLKVIELYVNDLPALTPSMAVICTKKNDSSHIHYPSKEFILNKEKSFKEKILGQTLTEKSKKSEYGFLNKLKSILIK